ncbi:MAG: hypothetical protein U1F30_06065 [Steroidobacteraceae bacterium]
MATFAAVYDACVLYPAPLRDLLVRLGQTGLFRAHWTDQFDLSPATVCQAVREQRAALVNPPRSDPELMAIFLTAGLASTVAALEEVQSLL